MESKTLTRDEVASIAKLVLKEILPKAKIERVEVNREGLTFPADLGIAVIFSGKGSVRLTGKQLTDIDMRMSSEISKRGDERFPYLRFMTAQEAKSLVS